MFSNTSVQRFQKSILIILFTLITISLIIAWRTPATGYESSIYSSTPIVVWVVLVSSELIGIAFVIFSLSNPDFRRNNLWKYAFFLIFFVYAVVLSLFIIRGYYMWDMGGDVSSHIGYTKEILQTGYISSELFYPALHIFLSEICLVTTLSPVALHQLVPLFFGLLCVVFFYMFVRVLASNEIEPIVAGIISCPFVFSLYIFLFPNGIGNMLLPLALFLMFKYLRDNNAGWGILFFIILIFYPVLHPLPSVVLGLILMTLWIAPTFREVWIGLRERNLHLPDLIRKNVNGKVLTPFLVLSIWFVFWYSSFMLWGLTLTDIYKKIISEGGGSSNLATLTSQVNYAQGYGYSVIEIFMKQYGGPVLVEIIAVFAFFLLWKTVPRKQKKETIFSLYGPWAFIAVMVPILYIFNMPFGPLRFLAYTSVLGTVFIAGLMAYLVIRTRENKTSILSYLIPIGIIIVLFTLFLSAIPMLYPSPYSYLQNLQNTRSEIYGMTNFLEHRNVSVPAMGLTESFFRFSDLLLTHQEQQRQDLPRIDIKPPWHFGYTQNRSISSYYAKEMDLVIEKADKAWYSDYFPNMAKFRFTMDDFERVKNDPGSNLVYSNGEYDLLMIKPKGYRVMA